MARDRQRYHAIKDELYASGRPEGTHECPECGERALKTNLVMFEGKASVFFECEACSQADHLNGLKPPEWA